MKNTLLSVLTTVAFAAPTFAADDFRPEPSASSFSVTVMSEAIETELNSLCDPMIPLLRNVLMGHSDQNANLGNSFWKPASFSVEHRMFHTLKALAERGVELVTTESQRISPLHSAVNRFSIDQFSELLGLTQQQGFDLNSQDCNGMTVLYSAINNTSGSYPSPTMIEWLINNGARTDLPATINDKTYLPLCAALCKENLPNREKIVELLKTGLTAEQIAEAEAQAAQTPGLSEERRAALAQTLEDSLEGEGGEVAQAALDE